MNSSGYTWLIAIVFALWLVAALIVAGVAALLVAAFRRKLRWAPFLIAFPIAFGGIFLFRAEPVTLGTLRSTRAGSHFGRRCHDLHIPQ